MKPESDIKVDQQLARVPVTLPAPKRNAEWSQPGGTPTNAPGHLQIAGGLTVAWRASVGAGSGDEGRLTAVPIIYQNRIYALDAEGAVSAFSASGGGRIWRVDLTPENEKGKEGYGGGIAAADGRLYVTTGFGTVVALDPANGAILWTRKVGVPIRSSPTAAGGRVYFVTTESRLICLDGKEGNQLWTYRGIPEPAALLSNVSPAAAGNRVVVPYPSGDLIAHDAATGKPVWVESLSRQRRGESLSKLSDPARPVIDRGVVFAVGHAGKMVATALDTGARLWTKSIASTQTPWVAGEFVFVVSTDGRLLALTRREGRVRWVTRLPESSQWNGPILASGRLWLVSAAGKIVGVDAKTGAIQTQRDIGDSVFIAPAIASGRMYVLSDEARLYAMN
ncbi:MAG: pyrrolo-quinoline quinone [Alphaproteobacteria bacterium]|nr:MAG: pyrrolo-quinoline quinone [Alphaproteobacteria bacterium]